MKLARAIFGCILALLVLLPQEGARAAITLLPNGEACFSALSPTSGGPSGTGTGFVGLLGTITGGSGGTAGTYGGVALTGGSGSGATANITVSGGMVTGVAIVNPGSQYVVGDVLSAASGSIGNVVGFSVPVSSVAINSSLAGGTVAMYVPNTSTFKQTWFNADGALSHQNTNPINLDANGCAIIYGTGSYRQVLKDSLGNTIWDQITTDTSATNNTFWAGLALASGTPNAIQVTDAGFNSTDGSIIQFIPIASNTGPTTLTPSGTGVPVSIVKDTASGAVALSGGEIVAGAPSNVVQVVYSASQNNFHLLNLVNTLNPTTQQTLCGAIGLKIANSSGTPNSQALITADQITAINGSFQVASRLSSSYTLNITTGNVTATANGMDGEAPGTSAWIYIWAIDNGTQGASLGSLSATAPTMPSGYSYKCRIGAMRVDGSGNLKRTEQLGNYTTYTVSGGIPLPSAATTTNANVSIYTAASTTSVVPSTATRINISLQGYATGQVSQTLDLVAAPNASYADSTSTNPPPCGRFDQSSGATLSFSSATQCVLQLESSNIYWGVTFGVSNAGNIAGVYVYGWVDKVNAN